MVSGHECVNEEMAETRRISRHEKRKEIDAGEDDSKESEHAESQYSQHDPKESKHAENQVSTAWCTNQMDG